ncbi:MAG: N-6 DNA methylase, partial [Anaerolineae bacterium]
MSTSLQLEMGLSSAHRNRYLFSDHYLEHILPDDPRWEEALSGAADFVAWLQGLYANEQDQLPQYNEGSLEAHWYRPILRELGHVFEPQPTVPGLDAYAKRPDYVFFPDETARQDAAHLQNQEEYADRALAVGEVKRWDTPLGKKRRGGGPSFEDRNPSWQIDYYLRTTGLDWGILSNGRLWRLVHRDTSHRLQIYYEVDLVQLLREGDPERLGYFTLFFRQAAFRPDARGRILLDDALAASNQYAVELEEDLEDNVYRALERLMQGFLDLPANELGPDDLRDIYDNSLYVLYRLLFILYGESRGLLPLDNDQYRTNYSLTRIKEEIASLQVAPAPRTTLYWGHLHNLFHIINGDDAELNRSLRVPRYNGGLFDPEQHPFLEKKQVGDRALVEAVDLLSRRETQAGREFADYRTMGVRHLGSIYEGLLEYQPRVADEPVLAIRDGGDERWVEASEAPEDARVIERRDAGEVYLETDRGERKATGSYYTPQYIVEYIVEHTVGPLVEEAVERVKERAKKAKTEADRAEAEQSLVEEILDLQILDPAMGSGHFLVEATEFLALALATDPYVETAETPEEDLTYWKRRVVERSIYGVDKNPLSVELAKLSLWLATVAADRPLSFLDHHLKCGDSLIGARVEDLGWAPPPVLSKKAQKQVAQQKAGQINMFEHVLSQMLPTVMGRILEITEQESKDYDTVRAKEAAEQAVRELKAPFEAVANLWTSAYFGNEFAQGDYDEALGVISQPDTLLGLEAVERAPDMAEERRFFHWELAFPEVFYDQN